MSGATFPYGTMTRPFPRNPQSFVPARVSEPAALDDSDSRPANYRWGNSSEASRQLATTMQPIDGDVWWQREVEIRELQEANRSLLQRVCTPQFEGATRQRGTRAAAVPPVWPLPLPLPTPSLGSTAVAGGSGAPANVGPQYNSAGGIQNPLPDDETLPPKGSARAALALLHDGQRLAATVAQMHEEVVELQQAARERESEFVSQRSKAQRFCEALASVEERNTELRNENERLQKVRETFEHQGSDGLDYAALKTYIDNDLATIRADRNDAEAALRAEVKQWQDTSEHLEVECRHAAHRHETMVRRLETVHAEHRSTKWAAEEAVVLVDESVEHRTAASEAAMRVLRQQFEIQAEENAKGMGRLRQAETDVMAHSMLCDELKLRLVDSEESHAARWSRFGKVQSEVEAREAVLRAEHRDMQKELAELEQHRIALAEERKHLAEERKHLKRDVARRTAEYQTRDDEMHEEAEQAVARTRDMHAKLSAARQDRQRAEGKLREQLQHLQAEWRSERERNVESQEVVEGWGRMQEELSLLRSEGAAAEAEFSSLRQKSVQTCKALKQENETLQRKVQTVTQEMSHRIQSVMYEERERCSEEAWEKICAAETRHSTHLSQLQEARDREVTFLKQAADNHREEAMAFTTVQRQLQEEAAQAQADECGAARKHAALLDALHREREAADSQLQQLLRQAEGEKQRKLDRLHEAFGDAGEELSPRIEPPLASTMATTWGTGTSSVARLVSASLVSHAAAVSPRSMAPSSVGEQFTTVSTVGGNSGADAVLRSLTRERETRRAHRLAEDLSRLISGVEQQVRSTDWSADCRRLLGELLALCLQAAVASAEEEVQLTASRDRESELRAQKQRADARCTHLTRLESQAKAHEDEVAHLESRLVAALAESKSLQASADATALMDEHCTSLQAELNEARAQLDDEVKRVQDWAQEEVRDQRSRAAEVTAMLEARAAEEHVHGLECRAILENHAAEQVARLLEVSEQGHEEFHSELMNLRRELQRGLIATSDEHGGAARREARLKAQLDSIRDDYMEAGRELREARKMGHTVHSEWEAACAQERKDHSQEQRHWHQERDKIQKAHANDRDILAKEVLQFQDERLGLEARLKVHQEEIEQLHATLQAAHEAAEQTAEKAAAKAREHRKTEHMVTSLEFNEEATRELLAETEAQLMQELQERNHSHNNAKEQLHALREDRLRDRSRQGKQFEKLRARVEVLEQTEATLERQAEHAERFKIKQAEDQAQRVEQLRRESRHLGAQLQGEQEQLANVRTSLVEVMTRFNAAEEECHKLASDKQLADATERSLQAEQDVLQERLSGRHEALRSAETLGQELGKRLQAMEEGPLREAIRAREELQQQHNKSARELQANNQALEHECMRMLSLLSPDGAKQVTDLQQSGALASAAGIAKVFECVAQELALSARENADLRASLVAEQTSRRRARLTGVDNSAAAPPGPPAGASSNSNNSDLASKLASVQKELIRAREKNLDLLNEKRLLEQRASELAAKHQKEVTELRVPETAVSSLARARSDCSTSSARPANSSSGPENVYLRHQVKQLQQGKAKADVEAQEAMQEMEKRCASLQTEMEEQRASVTKCDGDQSQAQKRIKALERKNQQLEEKLKDQRQLMAEKCAIEDQLSMAAKQLEALLADEHKDSDLQRDLAELSKQFEQLHERHRDQLAKVDKQNAQLQHAETHRSRLEEDLEALRQKAEAAQMQEASQERSMENMRAERATMVLEATAATSEVQQLLGFTRQEQQTVDSLRGDVERLRGELGRAHESLEQVRASPRNSRTTSQKTKRTEAEVDGANRELQASEAARRRLQAEARAQTIEMEELRLAVAAAEAAHQVSLSDVGGPNSAATEQAQEPLAIASARERQHERLGRNYERELGGPGGPREHLSITDAASSVVVCTAQDANLSSSLTAAPAELPNVPSLAEVEKDFSEFAKSIGFRGDIETLWAEAQARAADLDGSVSTQQHAPPQPRSAQVLEAAAQGPHSSQQRSPVQQDPPHRSRQQHAQQGYGSPQQPSFDELDVHMQQALTYNGHASAPLTADVDLRAAGKAVPMRGYPDSPPGKPQPASGSGGKSLPAVSGGAYPDSPGAAANWDGTEQTSAGSLPRWAQEAFQHAQLCCEQQRFNEAVPLFRRILRALEDEGQQEGISRSAVAEVWAHLGVAMQSLDRVAEAVESYQKAASLDPSLHVCFANLATLHAYLQERDRAVEYIERALALDSTNPTYAQIRSQLEAAATPGTGTESTAAGTATGVAIASTPAEPGVAGVAAAAAATEATLATVGSAGAGTQN